MMSGSAKEARSRASRGLTVQSLSEGHDCWRSTCAQLLHRRPCSCPEWSKHRQLSPVGRRRSGVGSAYLQLYRLQNVHIGKDVLLEGGNTVADDCIIGQGSV